MPEHQKFLTRLDERKQKTERIASLHDRITNFEFVSQTQKSPVTILGAAVEPTIPVRPSRARYLALGHRPELRPGHRPGLPAGIPRPLGQGARAPDARPDPAAARGRPPDADGPRSSTGGATSGPPAIPDSVEADAYRNLRASLLGVSAERGPIVTLLVTSAKAGEGKSTTALNLAATCAGPASGPS